MHQFLSPLLLFASTAGPSIITTMAGNDASGVITYSLSGAHFGYGLLIILPFLTIVYGLTQEIASRLAIVTGRGLADLIRERYGVRTAVFLFCMIFLGNFSNLVVDSAALKVSFELFGLHGIWLVVAFAVTIFTLFLLVTKLDYEKNQRLFLASMLLYIAYIISAFKVQPDWSEAFWSLVVPTRESFDPAAMLAGMAFVGTTITPWGQFFIQSFMKDKKLPLDSLKYSRIEAYFGAFLSNMVTFFIIVATKATLFDNHIQLASGEQAALAIKPFAGEFASFLYAFGLLNASLIGLIIISLSTAYAFTEFFGFEGTLDIGYSKGKNFYRLFIIQITVAAVIVLMPFVSVYQIADMTQAFNGILLPFIFYFIIRAASDRGLMGEHVIDPVRKALLTIASALIVAASIFSILHGLSGFFI